MLFAIPASAGHLLRSPRQIRLDRIQSSDRSRQIEAVVQTAKPDLDPCRPGQVLDEQVGRSHASGAGIAHQRQTAAGRSRTGC